MSTQAPSFKHLRASSARASRAAKGASRKSDTKPEVALRRELWHQGLRYRKNDQDLPGKPDIVFRRLKVAVFCDGDFWHGKDWASRKAKLQKGSNPTYWTRKIERNMQRDREQEAELRTQGWRIIRIWESDIIADPKAASQKVIEALLERRAAIIEGHTE